jgi:heme-degrading monooxygenase HmoA
MAEIAKNDICTQITAVKLPAENQQAVVDLMIERARFMATQPGFVSVNLHRSKDGTHLVNYIQWTTLEKLGRRTTRLSFARNGRSSASLRKTSTRVSTRSFTATPPSRFSAVPACN